ncbi:MAG: shikimate dehydrogenase [Flavobacteriales bacterium]|nr:shikimate dehydrogenase [Flavobacteriales bacterium]
MKQYGLIGHPLSHSFSKKYFTQKFENENIKDCSYELFDIKNIDQFPKILKENSNLVGLNITIPYKKSILSFLTEIDETAKVIGAVNTIKINSESKQIKGYNTDYYGFKKSLKPFLDINHERALILGTGGAAKTVKYVLNELNIDCLLVSRNPKNESEIAYDDVNEYVIKHHQLIVNTTPVGMFPHTENCPSINYENLTAKHLLYDLIYNPTETNFLKKGKEKGSITLNGMEMLTLQAEKSWEIWNSEL